METICLSEIPDIFNKDLVINDFKKILKEKTGIKEENQRIQIDFNYDSYLNNSENFWKCIKLNYYDISNYNAKLNRDNYFADVILNLNYDIENLKNSISKFKNISVDRLQFYLNNIELNNNEIIKDENLFKNNLVIKIKKKLEDTIKIKVINSEEIKEVKTDLYNTPYELSKDIKNDIHVDYRDGYNLLYNNRTLLSNNLLIYQGVKNGDIIELKERIERNIYVKTLSSRTICIGSI